MIIWSSWCVSYQSSFLQEAEQSVKLMIDSVAAAELDNVKKRQKEVVQVQIVLRT